MSGVIESILGNKATEFFNQHQFGSIGVVVLVVALLGFRFWNWWRQSRSSSPAPTATATGINTLNINLAAAVPIQPHGGSAQPTQPMSQPQVTDAPKRNVPPPGATTLLTMRPLPGENAGLEFINRENFDITIEVVARIIEARPTHKCHERYHLRWRNGRDSVMTIPAGRHATARLADVLQGYNGQIFLRALGILAPGEMAVEMWDARTGYAQILLEEVIAEPPLHEPLERHERVISIQYDERLQRIQVGCPLGSGVDEDD